MGAALYGGFVGTYLRPLPPADLARIEIPLSEVLPSPAGGVDTGEVPPLPPHGIGQHIKFPWSPAIKAVAIVPGFEVPTHRAREVLPANYSRADVVFNLQRIALLPIALGQDVPNAEMIHLAMQDRIHQPYRQALIPGLDEVVKTLTPDTLNGFLGVCLSGAGPTILALATGNYETIAKTIIDVLRRSGGDENMSFDWMILEPARGVHVV